MPLTVNSVAAFLYLRISPKHCSNTVSPCYTNRIHYLVIQQEHIINVIGISTNTPSSPFYVLNRQSAPYEVNP